MSLLQIVGHGTKRPALLDKPQAPIQDREASMTEMKPESEVLLRDALSFTDIDAYREAILLEKYRDTLLEHAEELRKDISDEIRTKSRQIAPRVFGWKNKSIKGVRDIKSIDSRYEKGDYESIYETLRTLETYNCRLEDKHVSQPFFAEMQATLLREDLEQLDTQMVRENYPWLLGETKPDMLFTHPVRRIDLIAAFKQTEEEEGSNRNWPSRRVDLAETS